MTSLSTLQPPGLTALCKSPYLVPMVEVDNEAVLMTAIVAIGENVRLARGRIGTKILYKIDWTYCRALISLKA